MSSSAGGQELDGDEGERDDVVGGEVPVLGVLGDDGRLVGDDAVDVMDVARNRLEADAELHGPSRCATDSYSSRPLENAPPFPPELEPDAFDVY